MQLRHCYFRLGEEITLHLNVIGVEAGSIVVVDYRLWFASIDVVLVLPAYKKCLVRQKNILTCKLRESQYLNNVSYVDFLVETLPGVGKLLVMLLSSV